IEQRHRPRRVGGGARVQVALVQAAGTVAPEFHRERSHAVPGPVRRTGNRLSRVLAVELREALLQFLSRPERRALVRSPGAELREAWPGREVRVGFGLGHAHGVSIEADLGLELRPPEDERDPGLRGYLAPFARARF